MKSLWKSKTFWFNLIGLIVSLAMEFSNAFPNGQVAKIAGMVLTVGNIILRVFFTSTAIGSGSTTK